jgi:hypothetical protein
MGVGMGTQPEGRPTPQGGAQPAIPPKQSQQAGRPHAVASVDGLLEDAAALLNATGLQAALSDRDRKRQIQAAIPRALDILDQVERLLSPADSPRTVTLPEQARKDMAAEAARQIAWEAMLDVLEVRERSDQFHVLRSFLSAYRTAPPAQVDARLKRSLEEVRRGLQEAENGAISWEAVLPALHVTARIATATAIGLLAAASAPALIGGPIAFELMKAGLASLVSAACFEGVRAASSLGRNEIGRDAQRANSRLIERASHLADLLSQHRDEDTERKVLAARAAVIAEVYGARVATLGVEWSGNGRYWQLLRDIEQASLPTDLNPAIMALRQVTIPRRLKPTTPPPAGMQMDVSSEDVPHPWKGGAASNREYQVRQTPEPDDTDGLKSSNSEGARGWVKPPNLEDCSDVVGPTRSNSTDLSDEEIDEIIDSNSRSDRVSFERDSENQQSPSLDPFSR